MKLHTKHVALGLLLGASALLAHAADPFPSKPIEVIITTAPGSASDAVSRFIGGEFQKTLGQPTVVLSKASASGTIGAEAAKLATPDGHSIFLTGNTVMSANVFLVKNLPYDPVKDFEPISLVSINPLILVIRADIPAKTVAEFIKYAKANPGKLNYGFGNYGGRVAAQMLISSTGITAQDVAYKGPSPAMLDMLAGNIDFMITDPLVADAFIKQGKVRALAVTSAKRLPSMSQLPTMMEAGVANYDYASYLGYYAPKGTPKAVIATLNAALVKAVDSPAGKEFFPRMAMIGKSSTPEELAAFQKEQTAMWGRLVKESGLKPE